MTVLHKLFLAIALATSSHAFAAPDVAILTKEEISAMIGNFPARGTQAEAMDDEVILDWQNKRTQADCDYAAESEVNITNFFGGVRGPLTQLEIKSLPFSITTQAPIEIGANILIAKKMYDRPRPYDRNPALKPCIKKESSSSYPSGHAMYTQAMGRLLSKRFPQKSELIMKRAAEAALNRLIGGVHHPSDIEAGKKLGDAIAAKIQGSHFFRLSR